eukprot:TRINITY_DN77929_c0_g1_i1.p1 TRINITY_DN77929_c0_g1~~TRINITY_DN77929_c0_g1_i1.p1  ORF type:complete len:205 (+),score=28.00 TRINITY_DN77929_c0_g1_i1:62-676(+)
MFMVPSHMKSFLLLCIIVESSRTFRAPGKVGKTATQHVDVAQPGPEDMMKICQKLQQLVAQGEPTPSEGLASCQPIQQKKRDHMSYAGEMWSRTKDALLYRSMIGCECQFFKSQGESDPFSIWQGVKDITDDIIPRTERMARFGNQIEPVYKVRHKSLCPQLNVPFTWMGKPKKIVPASVPTTNKCIYKLADGDDRVKTEEATA